MQEAGQRQLLRAYRSAWLIGGLEYHRLAPCLGEPDGGGEPVRSTADDDRGAHAAILAAS